MGHGFSGRLVVRAASGMEVPAKRGVLVAGIVPAPQRPLLSACPAKTRTAFKVMSLLSSLARQELKLPSPAINGFLCNGMDPMEIVQLLGFFGPLPTRVLRSKLPMETTDLPCPVTYIVLTQDKMIPPDAQLRIAERFEGVETVEIESCHQVMAQHPKELAEVLLRYAEDTSVRIDRCVKRWGVDAGFQPARLLGVRVRRKNGRTLRSGWFRESRLFNQCSSGLKTRAYGDWRSSGVA